MQSENPNYATSVWQLFNSGEGTDTHAVIRSNIQVMYYLKFVGQSSHKSKPETIWMKKYDLKSI